MNDISDILKIGSDKYLIGNSKKKEENYEKNNSEIKLENNLKNSKNNNE